jgi:hypothetical protein
MKKQLLSMLALLAAPMAMQAQNSCASAVSISTGTTTASTSYGTVAPVPSHCMALNGSESFLWYKYTATMDTTMRVSTATSTNTGLDTRVSVFTGTCAGLTCVAFGDDDVAYLSNADFSVTSGTTYYIVFDSYWGDMPIDLSLENYGVSGGGGIATPMISFTTQGIPGGQSSRCVVDMNNDRLDDIVVTNGNTLLINYQSSVTPGTFTPQSYTISGTVTNSPSWSIAGGDMDNNGFTDLIYGGGSGASIIMANASGTAYSHYSGGQYIFSQRTNVVDVDNDGIADAFVCHDVDANVYYESNGDGTFVHHQGGLGPNGGNYGSVWIDYDNDCDIDLFIAKCGSDPVDQLHRNNGDGTYTSVAAAAGIADATETWSSAWADYDNDGDMDVFLGASSNWSGSHKFYRNNGDGTFTDITTGSGFEDFSTSLGIENQPADFNNDGWVDVYGLGGLIMFNNGDMTFSASTVPAYSGATGDLNHDGSIDIVSGTNIYFNDVDTNNYLIVTTVGVQSNKQGIGARITVNSALGSQIRDVRSAEAFSSMQTLNAHFGLGQDTQIDNITICWPSGVVDVINNPAINSHLVITEGSTLGVEDREKQIVFLYPNPANGMMSVSGLNAMLVYDVQIVDALGRVVYTGKLNGTHQVDVAGLESGLYSITFTSGQEVHEMKFIRE